MRDKKNALQFAGHLTINWLISISYADFNSRVFLFASGVITIHD